MRDFLRNKYSIGYALRELRGKACGKMELRDVARIPMEKLIQKIGQAVFLGIFNGDHVIILDKKV